ncbi:MAG: diphosphate--fructose-6-phosphate 1-phosphotransferase, partial [Clostridia bacterium]|nr:diphosphate--fructose-6-phosphate 1-phosphotransferase [Clostridia bacterium]
NDLVLTDHTPGFSSAAKYIATTVSEVALDASIYESPLVIIVEIMGRDAGWLAASASLAEETGYGADLIYLPEREFSDEQFLSDVKKTVGEKTHVVVAVSEGIRYKDGRYVGEAGTKADVFGHTSLGGVCGYLKSLVTGAGVKCKAIELNVLQRCAAHIASPLDIEETFLTGKEAVKRAVSGTTDKMIAIERLSGDKYETKFVEVPLQKVANAEKKIPSEWINEEGNGVTEEFKNYLRPLIGGLSDKKDESGLPSYAKLKKVKFKL